MMEDAGHGHQFSCTDMFVPYDRPQDLPPNLGEAIKFFDQEFSYEELPTFEDQGKSFKDFMQISVPTDETFTQQGYTLQELKLMAGMLGRLQQPYHRYDRYPMLTIVQGIPRTGAGRPC